jgi:AraC family transcriptional regulator
MNRVLDYIDAHLDSPLTLPELASIAHFSSFHFHRMFVAWSGETLGDYVRRRRVERAAWLLTWHENESILAIALTVGFGSGEALSRAFKARFGLSPAKWRAMVQRQRAEDRNPSQVNRNFSQAFIRCPRKTGLLSNKEFLDMNVQIKSLPPSRIAYLRHIGPYGESVGNFWGTFHQARIAHGLEGNMFGVGLDDPAITPAAKCRYDACVEISADAKITAPFSVAQLPGGRYATLEYRGDAARIGEAWSAMFGQWLPESGMQADERPTFEWYRAGDGMDPKTGEFSCVLCIPVEPSK